MGQTVYTNYWVNRRDDVKKEHGSFKTEEEAIEAIKLWWEIQGDTYKDVEEYRTNTGALEITYGFDNYFYRIEKRQVTGPLPPTKYRLKTKGEIKGLRNKHHLDDDYYLFDELAEPYRDRLIATMADAQKVRDYCYTSEGKPIVKLGQ